MVKPPPPPVRPQGPNKVNRLRGPRSHVIHIDRATYEVITVTGVELAQGCGRFFSARLFRNGKDANTEHATEHATEHGVFGNI